MKGRKISFLTLCAAAAFMPAVVNAAKTEKKVKTVHLIQDDAQQKMVSKVYELKYVKGADLRPWIKAAVKRYNSESDVQRLNYKYGKKQYLLVNTPPEMMVHVDKLIATLDRPADKDDAGSVIKDSGHQRSVYRPKFRDADALRDVIDKMVISGDGAVFSSKENGTSDGEIIYWKDSFSDSNCVKSIIGVFDRPLPQVNLEVKVYCIKESDLKDYGLDYLAWKNGPGLELFGVGLNGLNLMTNENILNLFNNGFAPIAENFSMGMSGMFFAPSIDFSFIRILSQAGLANVVNSANLTMINDPDGSSTITLNPNYQNIVKGEDDMTDVVNSDAKEYSLTITSPIINFKNVGDNDYERTTAYNGKEVDILNYHKTAGAVTFDYKVNTNEVVERNNLGQELVENGMFTSSLTVDLDREILLGSWGRTETIEQNIGIPLLSSIPILKYLFSTTTDVETKSYYYVTVKGTLVHPFDDATAKTIELTQK